MTHLKILISDVQRANMKKLADYLSGGSLKARFDMSRFCDRDKLNVTIYEISPMDCGTVGCGIGHGPYAGIPKFSSENFNAYGKRQFTDDNEEIFDWCFDQGWHDIDNTPEGAGMRIHYFLEYGVPADYLGQLKGTIPYIFENSVA